MNSARNVTDRTKNMNARIITALLALLGFGVPVREFQARPLADSARGEGRLPSAEAQPEDVPAK